MCVALWSPPLDYLGNSVRGIQFCKVRCAMINKEYLKFFRNWLQHSTSTSLTPSWEVLWPAKRIRMIQEKARLRLSWGTQYWHHIEHTFLEKRSECCDAALCCSGWRHCSTAEAPPSGRRNIISDYKVKSKNRQFEQKLAETFNSEVKYSPLTAGGRHGRCRLWRAHCNPPGGSRGPPGFSQVMMMMMMLMMITWNLSGSFSKSAVLR